MSQDPVINVKVWVGDDPNEPVSRFICFALSCHAKPIKKVRRDNGTVIALCERHLHEWNGGNHFLMGDIK